MRIVHLSDLHLSKANIQNLKDFYMDALVQDLIAFNDIKKIDIVLITGDLLDRGGTTLGDEPYIKFVDEFINPISTAINLEKKNFLFIPGNHDVEREKIDAVYELGLLTACTKVTANQFLTTNRHEFNSCNGRIKKFKDFEKLYHIDNQNYKYSNNESVYIHSHNEQKIGFALINDSWRCSEKLHSNNHFIGHQQLLNAKRIFNENHTDINIIAFHHPLNVLNQEEVEEIENILSSQKFHIAFFGHSHKHRFDSILSSSGGFTSIRGRAALNNTDELDSRYQPGYNLLDLNVQGNSYTVFARKFIKRNGYVFDKDVESFKNGECTGVIERKEIQVAISDSSENEDADLPNGYTANVEKIVKLLIGKALYPNPLIFIRELIQNAVDACCRKRDKGTDETLNIVVSINTFDKFIEISDQGDGMTKKTLKEHFSIIGKSISEEFNETSGHFNLISRFGIGFISTFIAAQKVLICTKHDEDEFVSFEISDVFKGFDYKVIEEFSDVDKSKSGTTIRVYLKNNHRPEQIANMAAQYCRHINNLHIKVNGNALQRRESWNTEGGQFFHEEKNSKYEYRLAIGNVPKFLISSNSGFLINQSSNNLFPPRFPAIIHGEVNFFPRAIDFDMSRSNIMETEKSVDFRKEISVSLRILFRDVLEQATDSALKLTVTKYLKYYLATFDQSTSIILGYKDFYSKRELISLILENSEINYMGYIINLRSVIENLKMKDVRYIYLVTERNHTDHEHVFLKFLQDNGNLLISNTTHNVQFKDGQFSYNEGQFIRVLAESIGFRVIEITQVTAQDIERMKMPKNDIPSKLLNAINELERLYKISIDLASFENSSKQFLRFQTQYFINYNHNSFKSVLSIYDEIEAKEIKLYLLGILGLHFKKEYAH